MGQGRESFIFRLSPHPGDRVDEIVQEAPLGLVDPGEAPLDGSGEKDSSDPESQGEPAAERYESDEHEKAIGHASPLCEPQQTWVPRWRIPW